jgi:hypothetical protein
MRSRLGGMLFSLMDIRGHYDNRKTTGKRGLKIHLENGHIGLL